ncbi:hypothetical protein ABI_25970 [Asticcacaulis biprosthecium C19]|uniref:Uncharacterized protein n=1 Tax=Asticcacaulis biprosthecium C19 TaxID=715226 RepID=F4QPC4_9CAUL|nr:hypothetical protein ABI_25970 [Asticcacaulis biprosthecium C19]
MSATAKSFWCKAEALPVCTSKPGSNPSLHAVNIFSLTA